MMRGEVRKTQTHTATHPGRLRWCGEDDSNPKWQPRYEWGKGKATTQASFGNLPMNLKGLATGIQREREPGM